MREVKKRKDRVALALVLCFCVVALTSVFAVKASLDKLSGGEDMEISNEAKTEASDAQVSARTPVVDSQDTGGSRTENAKEQDEGSSPGSKTQKAPAADYVAPVTGSVLLKYSMDMPIYSETLDQYMTHSGTDIAAPLSSKVKAIRGGTITKVYKDDRYGMTVEITHDNGILSIYANLAEQGLAEMGDVVQQGQVIGLIGDTALFEVLAKPHLHLEMTKNSAYVDPADYIPGL